MDEERRDMIVPIYSLRWATGERVTATVLTGIACALPALELTSARWQPLSAAPNATAQMNPEIRFNLILLVHRPTPLRTFTQNRDVYRMQQPSYIAMTPMRSAEQDRGAPTRADDPDRRSDSARKSRSFTSQDECVQFGAAGLRSHTNPMLGLHYKNLAAEWLRPQEAATRMA